MHADYAGQGVDQLAQVLHKLRHTPNDRRIILSAWNPAALPEMALPPCHMFAQFYVSGDRCLSCQMRVDFTESSFRVVFLTHPMPKLRGVSKCGFKAESVPFRYCVPTGISAAPTWGWVYPSTSPATRC